MGFCSGPTGVQQPAHRIAGLVSKQVFTSTFSIRCIVKNGNNSRYVNRVNPLFSLFPFEFVEKLSPLFKKRPDKAGGIVENSVESVKYWWYSNLRCNIYVNSCNFLSASKTAAHCFLPPGKAVGRPPKNVAEPLCPGHQNLFPRPVREPPIARFPVKGLKIPPWSVRTRDRPAHRHRKQNPLPAGVRAAGG